MLDVCTFVVITPCGYNHGNCRKWAHLITKLVSLATQVRLEVQHSSLAIATEALNVLSEAAFYLELLYYS